MPLGASVAMFDTRGILFIVCSTAAQQPSGAAARSPRYTFLPDLVSTCWRPSPHPPPDRRGGDVIFLMFELWLWLAVWWMKVYLQTTKHTPYVQVLVKSSTSIQAIVTYNYCSSIGICVDTCRQQKINPSRQLPRLSKREWFVRIALHYIFWYVMDYEIPPLTNQFYNRP